MTYIQIALILTGFIVGGYCWVKGRMANNDWKLILAALLMLCVMGAGLVWFLETHS